MVSSYDEGSLFLSCKKAPHLHKGFLTTDNDLVTIPANAIIDSIEFFGFDGFATKESFSIGLGQLNHDLLLPLIIDTTHTIANEYNGGCREFLSDSHDGGKNNKTLVYANSFVNVIFKDPILSGYLQIIIKYHLKSKKNI
jgi:hypothetical protein